VDFLWDGGTSYRVYTVGNDGHFTGPAAEVEAADDSGVFAYCAEKLADGHVLEVWDHKRFVARIPSIPK
jgi:hypothetical protein